MIERPTFVNPSSKIDLEEIEMSKTKEDLNELKKEVESISEKLKELTPEELEKVNGGVREIVHVQGGQCGN